MGACRERCVHRDHCHRWRNCFNRQERNVYSLSAPAPARQRLASDGCSQASLSFQYHSSCSLPPGSMHTCLHDSDSDLDGDDDVAHFRTFEDLVSCPPAQKHGMPISKHEMIFFHEIIKEPDSDWKEAARTSGILVQKKAWSDSPLLLVRFVMDCDALDPLAIFHNLVDPAARMAWDKNAKNYTVVSTLDSCRDIVHCIIPTPSPAIADRDSCVHRRIKVDVLPEGEVYTMLQRSASHQSVPEGSRTVRIEVVIGGYTVGRSPSTNTTRICGATITDVGGQVPAWMINTVISKSTVDMLSKLRGSAVPRDANHEFERQGALKEWVRRYKGDQEVRNGQDRHGHVSDPLLGSNGSDVDDVDPPFCNIAESTLSTNGSFEVSFESVKHDRFQSERGSAPVAS